MHFGATLRLLRVDAGVSLRALAQQVGVSSAYLSRVENGHDQAPTSDRLLKIARALDLPPTLLIELAQRVTPFVTQYLADVPSASHLFLEIARRQLGPAQLARLHAVMDSEFPARVGGPAGPAAPRICELLRPERVVVRLSCAHLGDAIDVAATRLADADHSASDLAWEIHRREREAPTAVGHGVAIPHVGGSKLTPAAALVTLARPIAGDTPDGVPLQIVLVLIGAPLALLARAVRLATAETVASLAAAGDPEAVLARLRHAEAAFA